MTDLRSERFREALANWPELPGKRTAAEASEILAICDNCEHQKREKCFRFRCLRLIHQWIRNPGNVCPVGFWK